jgi:type IV secretion system protein VirD4
MHISSQMQIVFADNLRPMLLRKTVYWQRPSLRGRFNRNPYQARTPDLDHRTPFWTAQGLGLRFCAWLAGPSPFVMALLCFWVANGMHLGIWLGQTADSTPEYPVCRYLMTNGVKRYAPVHPKPGQTCSWIIFPGR